MREAEEAGKEGAVLAESGTGEESSWIEFCIKKGGESTAVCCKSSLTRELLEEQERTMQINPGKMMVFEERSKKKHTEKKKTPTLFKQ